MGHKEQLYWRLDNQVLQDRQEIMVKKVQMVFLDHLVSRVKMAFEQFPDPLDLLANLAFLDLLETPEIQVLLAMVEPEDLMDLPVNLVCLEHLDHLVQQEHPEIWVHQEMTHLIVHVQDVIRMLNQGEIGNICIRF